MATHLLRLGHACDHACRYCTVADDPDPELSREEALARVDAVPKGEGLTITGGEPTLHPDILEIVRRAKVRGLFPVDLQTHGAHLSEASLVDRLHEAGLDIALVSVPSHDPAVYRELTGKDDLAKVLTGIDTLLEVGIETNIDHVITARTYQALPDFVDFIGKRFPGVNRILLGMVRPNGACARHPELVPRLVELELYLYDALDRLRNRHAYYEVEGVPLCYLQGYEHHNAETQRALDAPVSYAGGKRRRDIHGFVHSRLKRKAAVCERCLLDPLCVGVWVEYAQLNGTNELFPIFTPPDRVRERMERYYQRWREEHRRRRSR